MATCCIGAVSILSRRRSPGSRICGRRQDPLLGRQQLRYPGPRGLRSLRPELRCACNQVLYHLQQREVEHAVLPWCERHQMTIVAYSPFGHGRFPSARSAQGRLLAQIGAAHQATPRQIALAFMTRNAWVATIPKASSSEHATENAAAGDLKLSDSELRELDAAFPLGRSKRLPML